jgi:hypothetical protein
VGIRGIGEAVQLALDVGCFQSVSGEAASSDRDRRFEQIHLDKIQHQRLVERVIETSRDDLRFGHRSALEPCEQFANVVRHVHRHPLRCVVLEAEGPCGKRTGYFYPLTKSLKNLRGGVTIRARAADVFRSARSRQPHAARQQVGMMRQCDLGDTCPEKAFSSQCAL